MKKLLDILKWQHPQKNLFLKYNKTPFISLSVMSFHDVCFKPLYSSANHFASYTKTESHWI